MGYRHSLGSQTFSCSIPADEQSLGLARAILLAASEMHELYVPPERSSCF